MIKTIANGNNTLNLIPGGNHHGYRQRAPCNRRPPNPASDCSTPAFERDLSDFLAEYGAGAEDTANHARPVAAPAHATTLAYGIPMPGVRYYTFCAGAVALRLIPHAPGSAPKLTGGTQCLRPA